MAAAAADHPLSPIPARVAQAWAALGIPVDSVLQRALPLWDEAAELAWADLGPDGRDKFLAPDAAQAWRQMKAAAQADGVQLQLVSAFRSLAYQVRLMQRKLDAGIPVLDALRVLAPPGCSEHHGGHAADIGTPGFRPAEEEFEYSPAFAWLSARAGTHGFVLSFPRGNRHGYDYEPWHWCHQPGSLPG